ncbi:hypothetical protein SRABI91_04493 [Rhodococcoides fascians]|nr:hypothetical protein SRABI91_04493 [Rhodococcus fascians]
MNLVNPTALTVFGTKTDREHERRATDGYELDH